MSRACAAIAPAIPVPWTCAPSLLPSASKLSTTELESSGWLASIPESMTATRILVPWASACASARPSLTTAYCAGSPSIGIACCSCRIRLHRMHTGVACKIAAGRIRRAAVGDAETPDGRTDQREILRTEPYQTMPPRQGVGLLVGQRAVDFGDEFVGDSLVGVRRRGIVARTAGPASAGGSVAGAAATTRRNRLAAALAVARAIGIAAGLAHIQVWRDRPDVGDVRIDARCRIDRGDSRPNVEIGRAHKTLRLRRQVRSTDERQHRDGERQRCGPHRFPQARLIGHRQNPGLERQWRLKGWRPQDRRSSRVAACP